MTDHHANAVKYVQEHGRFREGVHSVVWPQRSRGGFILGPSVEAVVAQLTKRMQSNMDVACETDDGLLNVHPESNTCDVCRE